MLASESIDYTDSSALDSEIATATVSLGKMMFAPPCVEAPASGLALHHSFARTLSGRYAQRQAFRARPTFSGLGSGKP